MHTRARQLYVSSAIDAPILGPLPLVHMMEGIPNAVMHVDIDGTIDHLYSKQLIKMIFAELCENHSFAEQLPLIQHCIEQVYTNDDVIGLSEELTRRFVDTGMTVDFLNERIDSAIDKWKAIDDLHSFLMEKLPSLAVSWRWNTGEFEYAVKKVNKKYELGRNNIYYCTEVRYDETTRRITRICPNIMKRKLERIYRDLRESSCTPDRFVFLGDTPQEEPYSARAAALAFWVGENAELRKSEARVNKKIPEAKYGLSQLAPLIQRLISASEELEMIEERDILPASYAIEEIKYAAKIAESGEMDQLSEVERERIVGVAVKNTKKFVKLKRMQEFRPGIAYNLNLKARTLQAARDVERQKSLIVEICNSVNPFFEFYFDDTAREELRKLM